MMCIKTKGKHSPPAETVCFSSERQAVFLYEQETRVWCGFYLAIYWDLYYNDADNRIVIDGELVGAERKDHLRPTDLIWIMPT